VRGDHGAALPFFGSLSGYSLSTMIQDIPYTRLPGRGSPRGSLLSATHSTGTLWLGEDHLLNVVNTGYAERYKRFYFDAIQAFIIVRDSRRSWTNVGLGFLALVTFGGTILSLRADVLWLTLLLLCVLAGWLLWIWGNTAFGPTCRCYVRTAVQVEELPALCRVPRARAVIDRLRPLIEDGQARLVPTVTIEELQDRGLEDWEETVASVPVQPSDGTPPPPTETLGVASRKGRRQFSWTSGVILYEILAVLLLVHAFVFGMIARFNNVFLTFSAMACTLALACVALPSLVRQGRERRPGPELLLSWTRIVLG